jgi:hypothetical protein
VPGDVISFLREAERRIERFQLSNRVPGFVPSDFHRAYGVLLALAADLPPGSMFCEWGSGFGVVTCLAALVGFDACGIEIDEDLVDAARRLSGDFELPVEFICGSFIPDGAEAYVDAGEGFAWLTTDGGYSQGELGLAPDDFDVIFAYPWPDEERLTEDLFERYAAVGAVVVTYHGGDDFRLRRKAGAAHPVGIGQDRYRSAAVPGLAK